MSLALRQHMVLDAYLRLSPVFQNKPTIAQILLSFLDECWRLENAAVDTFEQRLLGHAGNAQLEIVGAIVGEPRLGRDDVRYEVAIRGRVLANTGSGLPNEIIRLTLMMLEPDGVTTAGLREAMLAVLVDIDLPVAYDTLQVAVDMLNDATAATVSAQIQAPSVTAISDRFLFTETSILPTGRNGLGWTGDLSIGGKLDYAVG